MLRHARGEHLEAVIDKLREAGATIEVGDGWLRVRADARPRAVSVRTSEYPAFPTDMQAQLMALDCIADGAATITETIFENRFMHVNELLRLGAKIDVDGRVAVVQGVDKLSGANVMATDLRASAGLVIAGARRRRRRPSSTASTTSTAATTGWKPSCARSAPTSSGWRRDHARGVGKARS